MAISFYLSSFDGIFMGPSQTFSTASSLTTTTTTPTIYAKSYGGSLIGTSRDEKIIGSNLPDFIYAGNGNDIVYGYGGNDRLYGQGGNDQLFGGDGDDILDGGIGDDILYGEAGNDQLFGGDSNDQLFGGNLNDRLFGGIGNDYLDGGNDHDYLLGEAGADTLVGGFGSDILYGGAGVDQLTGGADLDWFRFDDISEGGDIITDFTRGADKIVLNGTNFGLLTLNPANVTPPGHPLAISVFGAATTFYRLNTSNFARVATENDLLFASARIATVDTVLDGMGNNLGAGVYSNITGTYQLIATLSNGIAPNLTGVNDFLVV